MSRAERFGRSRALVAITTVLAVSVLGLWTRDTRAGAAAETRDLVFLVDGSGSISASDWAIQKDGLAAVLQDDIAIPRNGSIAVGVVQWSFVDSGQRTRVEVPLTVINGQASVDTVVQAIQAMVQIASSTNPGDAIRRGTDLLAAGAPATSEWTLCMSTDGTTNSGEDLGTATAYARATGVDRYAVVGIEDPPFVSAADLRAHYSPAVFGGGSVTVARNAIEFANIIVGACLGRPVELRALEVNQAVQDWHNSVSLVTDKATTVRAFVQLPTPGPAQRVVGRLTGTRGGFPLPGSPLLALNPGSAITANTDIAARRGALDASLNFSLPASWRSGSIALTFDAAGAPVTCIEPSGPGSDPAGDCSATVTFTNETQPEIRVVGVSYTSGTTTFTPTAAELAEQLQRFRTIFPVGSINGTTDQSGGYTSVPSLATVNSDLAVKRIIDILLCFFRCSVPTSGATRYYGVLQGNGGGLANDIPGVVSSGFLSGAGAQGGTGYARNRGPHEVAHLLGRHHAVDNSLPLDANGNKVGRCGEVASSSAPGHTPFGAIGTNTRPLLGPITNGVDNEIWGLDNRFVATNTNGLAVIDPRTTFELMSYCSDTGPQARWISRFTYEGLRGAFPTAGTAAAAADPAPTDAVIVSGRVNLAADTATISNTLVATGAFPATSGSYRVQFLDSAGSELAGADFTPERMDADAGAPNTPTGPPLGLIAVPVPAPTGSVARIVVRHGANVIGTLVASAHAPSVNITAPAGGEDLTGPETTFHWTGSDADGDPIRYSVLYSADDGNTWKALAINVSVTALTVSRATLKGSDTARLRVIASDGANSTSVQSNAFRVADNPPVVVIDRPDDGHLYSGLQNIDLDATVTDPEDGVVSGSAIEWSSDLDGFLGSGATLDVNAADLSEGHHVLRAQATDTAGHSSSASVGIDVVRVAPPLGPCGQVTCPTGLRPRLRDVKMALEAFPNPSSRLRSAIKELASALKDSRWRTDDLLVIRKGSSFYDALGEAEHDLRKDRSVDTRAHQLEIAAIAKGIALAQRDDALAELSRKDREKFAREIASGDRDVARAKFEDAVEHYYEAWRRARG